MDYRFYNQDCIAGARAHLADNSVDLIITDPPYGIGGERLHRHYNRDESFVIDGYVDVPKAQYADFSRRWIKEAARVLKPGGGMYVVSGYTNLIDILNALRETALIEINHLIWKYNFGVYTTAKYISSHYHILYYKKGGARHAFNTFARYADGEKTADGGAANYRDREDVWTINREYQPGAVKNKNALPAALLIKMMQYSSRENDLICDFFLGGFSTAKVAKGLNRRATGFEIGEKAFKYQMKQFAALRRGYLLDALRRPPANTARNRGKPLAEEERESIVKQYAELRRKGESKKAAVEALAAEYGRGYWSVLRIVNAGG